jgi:hypothetical protein
VPPGRYAYESIGGDTALPSDGPSWRPPFSRIALNMFIPLADRAGMNQLPVGTVLRHHAGAPIR